MSTRTAKRRGAGNRKRGRAGLNRHQARVASRRGTEARERQAAVAGRAIPMSRDAKLVEPSISTRLVREAVKVIDNDAELVPWVEERLAAAQLGPGRPSALSVRSALICIWLLNVTQRNCHLINVPALQASLTWRVRRELGIDYLDKRDDACQVSYQQLLRVFNNIADTFDPHLDDLDDESRRARAADLQELANRLVRASVDNPGHCGDIAIDATLVWAWDRPTKGLNSKIERRGRDGDAGRPLALSQITDLEESDDAELADLGFVDDPLTAVEEARRNQGGRRRPRTRNDEGPPDPFRPVADEADEVDEVAAVQADHEERPGKRVRPGAMWVGRDNKKKSVFGYAVHTGTSTDPTGPSVIEVLAVTPAPAHPAKAALPLLRYLHDARTEDSRIAPLIESGAIRPVGNVVADAAYSANAEEWMHPIRELGGSAVFRLHRTNQEGPRHHRGQLFVDGRPYCSCMPTDLVELRMPRFPYTRAQMGAYQVEVERRRIFEMMPNGRYLKNGSRQFKSPHHGTTQGVPGENGGCTFCVDAFGNQVVDQATGMAKNRCCAQLTKTFRREELGLYQDEAYGTRAWYGDWTPRNRVEGSYGIMKSLAVVNWGRDYHHFTGLVRETLVATFAVMAHNFHVQRTHAAREKLFDERAARPGGRRLPSKVPSQTLPGSVAVAEQAAAAAAREASPRGPKGLEFLGTPRRAGP